MSDKRPNDTASDDAGTHGSTLHLGSDAGYVLYISNSALSHLNTLLMRMAETFAASAAAAATVDDDDDDDDAPGMH